MKKRVRSLRLGKETLHRLSAAQMSAPGVAGGVQTVSPTPISDAGDSCLQSCYFNTCYETCQWQAAKVLA